VRLDVQVGGVSAVRRDIARMQGRAEDLRPALDAIAKVVASANQANFDSEGAAGAFGRWAPLSPGYRSWKEKHYPGRPILVLTGDLRDALTSTPMQIQYASAHELVMGTSIPYGAYHQTGTPRMPRRAPVALTEQVKRDMVKVAQRYIATGSTDPRII
jgi:phage gpG-like protein